ncbi:MAG: diguanylate cyclase, partial [Thiohalorhabdaceae bacterium]
FYDHLWDTITRGEVFRDTFVDQAKDGSTFYLEESITPIFDADGAITHYVADGKDVTEQVRMQQELERLAVTDWLTGLPNRRYVEDELDQEVERSRRYDNDLALIMFDVDHFKAVNDRFGHDAGDRILKALSQTVAEGLRGPDRLGRWGGEEFMILAPETGKEGAVNLAERLRALVAATPFPEVKGITASFGVTTLRAEDRLRTLTRRVDEALYWAKEQGRNRVEVL